MADDTVDMEDLDNTRFWLTWDVASACRVDLSTAYRALVDTGWNADAARKRLEPPCLTQ